MARQSQRALQTFWDNHWTPDNPTNSECAISNYNPASLSASTYYVKDGSYLRLNNIMLSYELPKSLIKYLKTNNIKLSFTANNIATWTNYPLYDPDISSSNPLLSGLDMLSYPKPQTYIMGLYITF